MYIGESYTGQRLKIEEKRDKSRLPSHLMSTQINKLINRTQPKDAQMSLMKRKRLRRDFMLLGACSQCDNCCLASKLFGVAINQSIINQCLFVGNNPKDFL